MATRRLVVNADDLGLHPDIDAGILRAHREGVVTSATLLATGPSAEGAVQRARAQGLPLGVHLCLTTRLAPAAPPARVPSLAPGGRFRASWVQLSAAWARGSLRTDEVALELAAQLARARALGAEVDHLDAHQHLHLLPGVAAAVHALARAEGLPVRWPQERPRLRWLAAPGPALKTALLSGLARALPADVARLRAVGLFEAGRLTEPALLGVLERLPEGDWELGCHPGSREVQVPEDPTWRYGWEAELAALTSPRVRALLASRGIALTSYGALFPREGPTAAAR
ncbi:ChbG/HpnK family deacetylase [Aggregicoccus sp. 17bor-14]|uniref:ChbG/HpnK family deacetylase n=1 Tax=Myxococcaceae TaxID=31 RepID=UPI0012F205AF|nr:ChbG/HpnK family deacetylase [Simulacricoccus sp. 17bor-14]MRI88517.1 ChbG/HpnK family deacetylase [Aggregicoccus sp. 17bor-14]